MRPFSSRLPLSTSRPTLLTLLVVSSCLLGVQTLATTHRRKNNDIGNDFDSSSNNNSNETPSNNTCETPSNMTKFRSVRKILESPPRHWVGDGFHVYPVFSNLAFTEELSPLLMFDFADPKKFNAKVGGAPRGVGQHPHRGFETVTVAFQGEVEHHDSTGKTGLISEGDVQWMTAGRGIIHQEYHSKEFTRTGGTFEMCQLWVNLPKKHKMVKPGYQAITKDKIPQVTLPLGAASPEEVLGTARIIAGQLGETKGAASTYSPVQMWDINLPHAGAEVDLPFPADHNCIVFVRRGSVEVLSGSDNGNEETTGGKADKLKTSTLGPQDVALLRLDGSDMLRLRVVAPDSSVLILGGEPILEPIAAQGPFVMNTQDEIRQAIRDFSAGKMGR